jgi:hypothetical protein
MGKKFVDMSDNEKAAYKEGRKDGVFIAFIIFVLIQIAVKLPDILDYLFNAWLN